MKTNMQRLVIYNRAESDANWIHIVPKGELYNSTADITQVLDDKAMDSIMANIEKDRNRQGDNWPGIYAGKEHFIYDPDQDSAALGWFKNFQLRDNGIWAHKDGLTPDGRDALANKKYKYTSFVADRDDLEHLGGNRHRVKKIETVGFTNMANARDLLTPIMNRGGADKSGSAKVVSTKSGIPRVEINALNDFFEAIAAIMRSCRQRTGCSIGFKQAWDLAKAQNPDLYHEAFGQYMDEQPAMSEAEAQAAAADVSSVANRLQTVSGMDFRSSWNFVRDNLPRIFNRRFKSESAVANRPAVNQDQYAGIQKRAAGLVGDLARAESVAKNIPLLQAFRVIKNREPVLHALANHEITPQSAFERDHTLKGRLYVSNRRMDTDALPAKAKRYFDKLLNDARSRGIGNLTAHGLIRQDQPELWDFCNGKITFKELAEKNPALRDKLILEL